MKSFKMFLMIASAFLVMSVNANAQTKGYVHTVKSYNYGKIIPYAAVQTHTTTDSIPYVIDSLKITDNTSGMIEVTCVGSSTAGNGVTGKLAYRYKKVSGTITLSSATNEMAIVADTEISGGTFAMAATSSNNLKLTVTGKTGITVKWRSCIVPYYHL